MTDVVFWYRIFIESGTLPADGDIQIEDIPPALWEEHRKEHAKTKVRYRLGEDPVEAFAQGAEIMVGYGKAPGAKE